VSGLDSVPVSAPQRFNVATMKAWIAEDEADFVRLLSEVLRELTEQRQPMIITQNGEAKAVPQDVASYEQTQETLARLKILALGTQQVAQGRAKPLADVAQRLRALKLEPA
jgi:prevent-host-death family protein